MSLRGKIVLLFLGFAVIPLLTVAGVGYWQTARFAEDLAASSLDESASRVAQLLDESTRAIDWQLSELRSSPLIGELLAGTAGSDDWRAFADNLHPPLTYIEVRAARLGTLALAGSKPTIRSKPSPDEVCLGSWSEPATFQRELVVGGQSVEIEGGIWIDELAGIDDWQATEEILVLDRSSGAVLASSSCATTADLNPALVQGADAWPAVGASRRTGAFRSTSGDRPVVGRATTDRPWAVVVSGSAAGFAAPLKRLQATYWLFVLMLAVATVLAFSLFLDRVVLSLEELTRAADKIGEGELNPWLPPPGDDEVGRLTLAFSGMLERVRQAMLRVDQGGRLAVIGQLSAYLAHEIRNPLSSIRMNLQSLKRDVGAGRIPEACGDAIEISLKEVDRLAGAVTSVLQLGRPATGAREVLSLHDIIEEAADLLTPEFRRAGVVIRMGLDAAADQVVAEPGQLQGVFVNLLMNALDAQPDGGEIEVRSALASAAGRGPVVAVHVRDHGRGISPELRDRIFEPFFTTKNQGSGIGLALAVRTIRESGGDLYLADLPELQAGAEFVVELPLAAVAAEAVPEPAISLPPWMDTRPSYRRRRERAPTEGLPESTVEQHAPPGALTNVVHASTTTLADGGSS